MNVYLKFRNAMSIISDFESYNEVCISQRNFDNCQLTNPGISLLGNYEQVQLYLNIFEVTINSNLFELKSHEMRSFLCLNVLRSALSIRKPHVYTCSISIILQTFIKKELITTSRYLKNM